MLWLMAVPSGPAQWLCQAMEQAMADARRECPGLTWDVIATLMHRSATQLSRQKQGHNHFSMQDYLGLAHCEDKDGRAFGKALAKQIAALFGLDDLDAVADRLREELEREIVLSITTRRMAKATLFPVNEEKRTA